MLTTNRWRNWRPLDEKNIESPGEAPSKPSKPPFEGFEGSIPGTSQIISSPTDAPAPRILAAVELLPSEIAAWDDVFLAWTRACCVFKERCWSSVSCLYVSHVEWAARTGQRAAGCRETFVAILMALTFTIQDGLVYGLMLKEDLEAARWKPTAPQAKPVPRPRRKWGV